jgi:hypothetical protein
VLVELAEHEEALLRDLFHQLYEEQEFHNSFAPVYSSSPLKHGQQHQQTPAEPEASVQDA